MAAALYAAFLLIIYAPPLICNRILYLGNLAFVCEPVATFLRHSWLQGQAVPFWNPAVLSGAPAPLVCELFAYPPALLFLLLPFWLATWLFVLLHQFFAAIGAFLWMLSLSRADHYFWQRSFLFGLFFAFSGYMLSASSSPGLLAAATFIPLELYLTRHLIAGAKVRHIAMFALVLGLQICTGRTDIVELSVIVCLTYLLAEKLLSNWHGQKILPYAAFLLALVWGAAAGAANLLPFWECLWQFPANMSASWSGMVHRASWPDLSALFLSGPVQQLHMSRAWSSALPLAQISSQPGLYLGAPVLVLALLGFCAKTWRLRYFWLLVLILSLLAVFSNKLPMLLYWLQPFRHPFELAVFAVWSLAIAAVEGWSSVIACRTDRRVVVGALIVSGAILLTGLFLVFMPLAVSWRVIQITGMVAQGELPAANVLIPGLALQLVIAGASAMFTLSLLLGAQGSRESTSPGPGFVVASLAGALLLFDGASCLWNGTANRSIFQQSSQIAESLKEISSASPDAFRYLSLAEICPLPDVVRYIPPERWQEYLVRYAREVLAANTGMNTGLLSTGGGQAFAGHLNFLQREILPRTALSATSAGTKANLPLAFFCQASATRYLLCPMMNFQATGRYLRIGLLPEPEFSLIEENPGLNLRIYQLKAHRNRFSIIERARSLSRHEALRVVAHADTSGYSPMQEVLVSPAPYPVSQPVPVVRSSTSQAPPESTLKVLIDEPDRLKLSCAVGQHCYLVIADQYHPGWQAKVDGKLVPLLVADGFYRAVELWPGRQEIVLNFRSTAFETGSLISLAACLLAGLAILLGRLKGLCRLS